MNRFLTTRSAHRKSYCFLAATALTALAFTPLAQAFETAKATQLTPVIGTGKMEGAVSDLAGNFYFCNMAHEKTDVKKNGNIGVIRVGATEPMLLVQFRDGIRGNGLQIGPDAHLYMADQQGSNVVRINIRTREYEVLHHFPFEDKNWNTTPNDLAFSKDGKHLYISSMKNGVYMMTLATGAVEKVATDYANGLEASPDGKRLILATGIFDIQPDGTLKKTDITLDLPQETYAYTDGLRCDAEGSIYVSRAGKRIKVDGKRVQQPGAVHVFSPDGKLIKNIELPYSRAHNVGFGGLDGKTLFIICPGDEGFVATYENDIPGLNQQRLAEWAGR